VGARVIRNLKQRLQCENTRKATMATNSVTYQHVCCVTAAADITCTRSKQWQVCRHHQLDLNKKCLNASWNGKNTFVMSQKN